MAAKSKSDPFDDETTQTVSSEEYRERTKKVLKSSERGTFVETALSNSEYVDNSGIVHGKPIEGQIVPAYKRVTELSDDLQLVPLEEVQGEDLCIWHYDEQKGDLGEYITMEVSLARDLTENKFLVNCGGQDAIRKIKSAFGKVDIGEATLPLVASFTKKLLAGGSRSFWLLS